MSITDPLIGSQLGDYTIVDILGRGGMARVYRGFDAKLERYAAVKVIESYRTNETEEEYRQRFQREARSIARLNHPAIVKVYQFGQTDTIYYMAMEFIEGRDLGQILKDLALNGQLMERHVVMKVMSDIADALDHAHKEGVIHRDVKPSNIMVKADGHAVLTDFGLALSVPEGSVGNTFGSAHYIAPEQAISSAQAVPQSDLYSLGVVLYQILVGKVPFDDPSAMSVALKHLSDPPPPPRLFNPRLSQQVEQVILTSLQKEPLDRYATGKTMMNALKRAYAVERDDPMDEIADPDNPPSIPYRMTLPDSKMSAMKTAPSPIPTAPEISQSRPVLPPTKAKEKPHPLMSVIGILIVVLVVVGIAALLVTVNGLQQQSALTQTPTAMNVAVGSTESSPTTEPVVVAVTEEATEITESTETVTEVVDATEAETEAVDVTEDVPTETATQRPSRTPTEEATPEVTEVPTETPTEQASETPAPTEEATVEAALPAVTENAGELAPVSLIYDGAMLVVYNRSDETVDMSNIQFVRTQQNGTNLVFRSNDWIDAARLPAGDCLQVWINRYATRDLPDYCAEQHSWRAVPPQRWFWISQREEATFEVRRNNEVLAVCKISDGECAIDP